jgi:cation:H+ antiporter
MTLATTIGWLAGAPWAAVLLFVAASLLLVWALERLAAHGLEGTALGTIAVPFCSGLGNLVFVGLIAHQGGDGGEVAVNALVNNVTNLTLLLGLPALWWGLELGPGRRRSAKAVRAALVNRLSLLLSLGAAGCFAGVLWALAADGTLDRGDGAALVVLFLFWQGFQVYDVLKGKVQQNRRLRAVLLVDALAMLAAGALIYVSVEAVVASLGRAELPALGGHAVGWITGWVMVLPNALLALFYAWRRRGDVVYSSQLGDGHICIPLCVGLAALVRPFAVPAVLPTGLALIAVVVVVHAAALLLRGGLPRLPALALSVAYGFFVWRGLA